MGGDVFITTIEIHFGSAISFVINQIINSVFRIGTVGTIGLKRPVLCAKKKVADQPTIIRKNVMFSEIELKIAFERDITITRPNATPGRRVTAGSGFGQKKVSDPTLGSDSYS